MSRIFSWRGYNNLTLSLVSKGVKLSKRGFFFFLEQDAAMFLNFILYLPLKKQLARDVL